MDNPKISVIIPVYNVEAYLRKCLDSVVNQSYKNLEIILVDDGSPDGCGKICDEYAQRDDRIRVIHKENGGVSSARNAGLEIASGDWIGWVDSDDWIELDMYEYMLQKALEYGADIAVCSRYERYKDKSIFRGWEEELVLNTEQAMELLLQNDIMQNFLWDKLWRAQLFADVRFPEGKTFEDIAVVHRLFLAAKSVVCLPDAKYNYLQRPGSIVDDVSLPNRLNHYRAARARYEEMHTAWPELHTLLVAQCVASAVGIWCAYLRNPREARRAARPTLTEIAAFSGLHCDEALRHMKLGVMGRAVLRLLPYDTWWAFALARIFSWLYQCKHGRTL